ncbi:MAG: hypothetical protein KC586_16925 [Myxococcales bacterium]|nr:hypothetical protein [Myxococcales bacterium]
MRLSVALLFLFACGGDPEPPGELVVELGTGEVAFEALTDGTTLPLVAGPQGGHHVWIGFRVAGMASDRAYLTVEPIPLATGELPPRAAPVRVILSGLDDGRREYFGWPAQLAEPGCLVGEQLILRVTIEDERGSRGSDERTIVVGKGTGVPACPE